MAVAIPLVFGIGGTWVGGSLLGAATFGITGFGAVVGGMAGMMVGQILFPPKQSDQSLPRLGSYQLQTTLSGNVIPVVQGTCRLAGNIVILGDPHPYVIVHKVKGGKGIGGGSASTSETRYKRSFLIAVCEGPATILRIWKGKEEIELDTVSIFPGDGNVGLAAVLGKEFGHYKNLCCVWFEEYELGNSDALPMFSFEIASESACNLVVGGSSPSFIWFDSSLNDTVSYSIPGGTSLEEVRDISYHAGGAIFVVNDAGYLYHFLKDGTLDTSWGNEGSVYVSSACRGVLYHSDDFIFVTHRSWASDAPSMSKFDSDGTLIWQKRYCAPLTSQQWQNKMIEHSGRIIATLSSNWPKGTYGIGVNINTDGSGYRYIDQIWRDSDLHGYDVAIDSNENVYIVSNRGISKFTLDGTWIANDDTVKPIYGITIAKVDGVDKIFIASFPWNGNSVFRMDTNLNIEKSYNIGNVRAYSIHSYLSSIYVGSSYSPTRDKDTWLFDFDLNLRNSFVFPDIDSGTRFAIESFPPTVGEDMNPADILEDIITNKLTGGGLDSSIINSAALEDVYNHCLDNDISISILLDNQQPLLDWIGLIQSHYCGYAKLG